MAKEMLILFVYDTEMLHGDNEDLASAILYFHPTWVSDQQKTALCGQLIGTVHCVKNLLTAPKIVSLQSGKFYVKEYGRYLMAVGTDRNIADWLLEHRATTMCSLINFLHQDIEVMSKKYENNAKLSAKLYLLFETYLKYLFVGGNIFSYIPSIKLPKSASNAFLEAIHLLECCQEVSHVLGGTLLYHNKVVATQLNSDTTKRLVLIDPYRIKYPAEAVTTDFEIPMGVQLLQVYVSAKEYGRLHEEATRCRTVFQYLHNKTLRKINKPPPTKEPIFSAMKRDQSIIFTSVPEEDTDNSRTTSQINIQSEKPIEYQNRPKFLNLKSKIGDLSSDMKNLMKQQQTPLYNGQTSVCSTPMTELNRVVHSKQMSICIDPVDSVAEENQKWDDKVNSKTRKQEPFKDLLIEKSQKWLDMKLLPLLKVASSNLYDKKRNSSAFDVREKLKSIDKSITMKYYNNNNTEHIETSSANNSPVKTLKKSLTSSKSITDPNFPIFKSDGTLVSHQFYKDYVNGQIEDIKTELKTQESADENKPPDKHSSNTTLEDFDCCMVNNNTFPTNSAKSNYEQKNTHLPPSIPRANDSGNITSETAVIVGTNSSANKEKRKSLTLPLKPLTNNSSNVDPASSDNDSCQTKPGQVSSSRRNSASSGVLLTPLMSKLSSFTLDDAKSSGFCSKDQTPCFTPGATAPSMIGGLFSLNRKIQDKTASKFSNGDCALQKCVLLVCGQQDMVVNLLLQEECCSSEEAIRKLWELCTENLGKLEKQLQHCLETYPSAGGMQNDSEPYSYLHLDQEWDTVQRGGPWGSAELGALTFFHRDFKENPDITEILMRCCDGVIYGHHCGQSEVFYHQPAGTCAGPPPPADLMGNISLKAKRRLERDHSIILL